MYILSFDSAVQNMGVVLLHFNENWLNDLKIVAKQLNDLYTDMPNLDKNKFILSAKDILIKMNKIVDDVVSIRWMNVIDLIPGDSSSSVNMIDRTLRLKTMLTRLDETIGVKPDIVLIEYQMKQNDISRAISNQILYHYIQTPSLNISYNLNKKARGISHGGSNMSNTDSSPSVTIHCGMEQYKLKSSTTSISSDSMGGSTPNSLGIEFMNPVYKNNYCIAPGGEYTNFIAKYSSYSANKKHCTYNFTHFVNVMGYKLTTKNKLDDVSDAFMQALAYIKRKGLL